MPELPEVETVRATVAPHIVGRAVVSARLLRRDVLIVPGDPVGGFSRQSKRTRPARMNDADLLVGATVTEVRRHGKQMAILTCDPRGGEQVLGVQLGMTGHLEFVPGRRCEHPKHTHAVIAFDHGTLVFSDVRRFGTLRAFRSRDALNGHWAALGPDALSISARNLARALSGSRRPIKAALLDQSVLAGVGNIYADEALFLAGVSPRTLAARLRTPQLARLAEAIRRVLSDACQAGGSTLRDFASADGKPGVYQDAHRVYGRGGLPCLFCSATLRSALVAQRTTVWCPHCQATRAGRAKRPAR